MRNSEEERIDRRAHWIQLIATGIVLATGWCIKLELKTSQNASDFNEYKREMKQTVKEYDQRLDDLHDRVLTLELKRR